MQIKQVVRPRSHAEASQHHHSTSPGTTGCVSSILLLGTACSRSWIRFGSVIEHAFNIWYSVNIEVVSTPSGTVSVVPLIFLGSNVPRKSPGVAGECAGASWELAIAADVQKSCVFYRSTFWWPTSTRHKTVTNILAI